MVAVGRNLALLAFALVTALFALWTGLVVVDALEGLDRSLLPPVVPGRSELGQVLEALAFATHPAIVFTAVAGCALWAHQRRLRRLALGIAASIPASWGGYTLVKHLAQRPRPDSPFADSLTHVGPGYPSGHMVAMTVLVATVVTLTTAQRRSTTSIWVTRLTGSFAVVLVGLDRWLMRAHWFSDLVGGVLFGLMVAMGGLQAGGARHLGESLGFPGRPKDHVDKRAAIIVNPSKMIDYDLFRRRVDYELLHRGWKPPLWLETTIADSGVQMARDARDKNVDLVMVAGGDGTVRTVCSELTSTQVPVALIPAGTGNLLARNLGVPLDEEAALNLAFEGTPTPVDVVAFRTEEQEGHFVVMSGMGLDAQIMIDTNSELKRIVGSAAYFLAAAQQRGGEQFPLTATLDDREPVQRDAVLALVGNVGTLQGGIQAFADADPYDARLDVLVANPTSVRDWARVAQGILGGAVVEPLEFGQGGRVRFESPQRVPYQLDGDAAGETSWFEAECVPGGINVLLPAHPGVPPRRRGSHASHSTSTSTRTSTSTSTST